MKKTCLLLLLLCAFVIRIQAQSPLCPSAPTSFCCEYVSEVNINGNITTGATGFTGPGYFDFTANSAGTLTAGNTYPVSVTVKTNSTYQEYVKIWFDFNGNGNLADAGELVFDLVNTFNGTHVFSGNVMVPLNAYNGNVYIRIVMTYANSPTLCGSYAYGNTLDYKATITGGMTSENLTVSTTSVGTATGAVISSPAGIDTANGFDSANFALNQNVVLTAIPTNAGSTFLGWSGDATGTANPLTVTMDSAKNIVANFGPPTSDIDTDGDGVTDSQELIDSTNPSDLCDFKIASQTSAPSAAWNAADCDTDGVTNAQELIDTTDPLNADTDGDGVTDGKEKTDATDPKDFCKLIVSSQTLPPSPAWNAADCDGDGASNGAEIDAGTDPLSPNNAPPANLNYGPNLELPVGIAMTSVTPTVEANPAPTFSISPALPAGLIFDPTTGTISGTPTVLLDTTEFTVTATNDFGSTTDTFTIHVFDNATTKILTISITSTGGATGTVVSSPAGIDTSNGFNSANFATNQSVVLTATPTSGTSVFIAWSGDATGTANPLTVTMDSAKNIVANFGPPTSDIDTDGDGITDNQEAIDNTNPSDLCDFKLASQTLAPSAAWNAADCDTDGVTNAQELIDTTDLLNADTDGDGVTDGKEKADATDPKDFCKLIVSSQTLPPSPAWNAADCDGDGASNGAEIDAGTDPLSPSNAPPANLNYGPNIELPVGIAMTTVTPTVEANPAPTFSIGPPLPAGLTFDTTTGAISGTPTVLLDTTEFTVTATNDFGSTTDTFTIHVFDNVNPTITAPDAVNVPTNAGCTATDVVLGTPITADNYAVASATNDAPTVFPLGNTNVTWTVTDSSGNTSTAVQVVTVTDNIPPVITANNISVELDSNGQASVTPDQLYTDATDNCTVATVTASKLTFDCDNAGENTVELIASDGSGNVTTANVTVTVTVAFAHICDKVNIYTAEAITPNGDGINDTWVIFNIENHPGSIVRVFNRWGSQVFYAKNYKNDWNGSFNDKDTLPEASSYLYEIDLDGDGSIDNKGWLYITR